MKIINVLFYLQYKSYLENENNVKNLPLNVKQINLLNMIM